MKADHGRYFVIMYKMSKLHEERKWERNKTKKIRKKGEEDINTWKIISGQLWIPNYIIEYKGTAVKL